MTENGIADGTTRAEFFGHFRAAFAVGSHIIADEFKVDVMEEPGEAPLVFIFVEASGEGPHDGFGGEHVADKVFVFNVLAD
jgi:hypothetical protein